MSGFMGSVVAIFGLLATVAIISAVLSPKAQTSKVIGTTFQGFGGALGTALSPITGASSFGLGGSAYGSF